MNQGTDYWKVLSNFIISFLSVIVIFIFASFIKKYFFIHTDEKIFGVIGAVIILGGSLGHLIHWNGLKKEEYLSPDRISRALLIISYLLGSFFIFLFLA